MIINYYINNNNNKKTNGFLDVSTTRREKRKRNKLVMQYFPNVNIKAWNSFEVRGKRKLIPARHCFVNKLRFLFKFISGRIVKWFAASGSYDARKSSIKNSCFFKTFSFTRTVYKLNMIRSADWRSKRYRRTWL
mgnify:CR=1 FL=1